MLKSHLYTTRLAVSLSPRLYNNVNNFKDNGAKNGYSDIYTLARSNRKKSICFNVITL